MSVTFTFNAAGGLEKYFSLVSYRDLVNGENEAFQVFLLATIAFAACGLLQTTFVWFKTKRAQQELAIGFGYELFSRVAIFVYSLVFFISWKQQVPMSIEYKLLLDAFLDQKDLSHDSMYNTLVHFFEVKTHMYSENEWLKAHRVCGYIMCYLQFFQLVNYFNAHPRMSTLTQTVTKAMDNILHFAAVFLSLFMMLAYMGHWMLGEDIRGFRTMGSTIATQIKMLFGEFIYAEGAETLSGVMQAMYWVYAITFMLIVVFTLLNFFLAIVVDSFIRVKEELENVYVTEQSFLYDSCDVVASFFQYRKHGWPKRSVILTFLYQTRNTKSEAESPFKSLSATPKEEEQENVLLEPQKLMQQFKEFESKDAISGFFAYYHNKSRNIMTLSQEGDAEKRQAGKS
eukprot:gnl/MRDRNA2_/MRDRNA2_86268_c0_seq1.p1 gnl/MRDRNA2_/MRDRNA2_86268_c0~~gnl/MRDRNA2_/MRDRNA2_86268_c0_seq1.p1  ORF type:complete len:424 (-),score=81.67 gnl/MRDRNA2_/MRDRNA2_86268_c0_seq1:394-1590(-)